jgi:N-acetylmuramoyl-L-alanine amidase
MKGWGLALGALLLPARLLAEPACKIAVDIGHHRAAPGATSARGQPEWSFNAALAGLIVEALRRQGVAAVLLNPAGDPIELRQRPADAAAIGATLLLSIHHDSVQEQYLSPWQWQGRDLAYSDRFSGYGLFVSAKNPAYPQSVAAAKAVGDTLLALGLAPSLHHAEPIPGENRPLIDQRRGIYRYDDLIVLKYAAMPALLIEAGIIVNRQDEETLTDQGFRLRFSEAVAEGIANYCRR